MCAAVLRCRCCQDFGQIASSDDVYLAQRGLRTMHVHLAQHCRNALKLARWLQEQPEVQSPSLRQMGEGPPNGFRQGLAQT